MQVSSQDRVATAFEVLLCILFKVGQMKFNKPVDAWLRILEAYLDDIEPQRNTAGL
jgi:hypothetical protein